MLKFENKNLKISIFKLFIQNHENHDADIFYFLILFLILYQLLAHVIRHFKALDQLS